MPCESLAAAI